MNDIMNTKLKVFTEALSIEPGMIFAEGLLSSLEKAAGVKQTAFVIPDYYSSVRIKLFRYAIPEHTDLLLARRTYVSAATGRVAEEFHIRITEADWIYLTGCQALGWNNDSMKNRILQEYFEPMFAKAAGVREDAYVRRDREEERANGNGKGRDINKLLSLA
ncbi:MAG: hypothetical protein P4M02_04565 [Clostridia bacterium]|nr:hypothetical protein [Clostridia bacterium]